MADGGRKRGRTSPLSAFFRWKTALRRVLVLFLLWAALSHQAGVVDDGVLHDPTARMAAFVGADFDYVIVFAVVTPPNPRLAESPQSLSAASAAAGPREPLAVEATQTSDGVSLPHELSDLRQKVQAVAETLAVRWPVDAWLVGEEFGDGMSMGDVPGLWIAAVVNRTPGPDGSAGAGHAALESNSDGASSDGVVGDKAKTTDAYIDGGLVAAMRRDFAWRLARALDVEPSSVFTAVLAGGLSSSAPGEIRDSLRRIGARDVGVGETLNRTGGEESAMLTLGRGDMRISLAPEGSDTYVTVTASALPHGRGGDRYVPMTFIMLESMLTQGYSGSRLTDLDFGDQVPHLPYSSSSAAATQTLGVKR